MNGNCDSRRGCGGDRQHSGAAASQIYARAVAHGDDPRRGDHRIAAAVASRISDLLREIAEKGGIDAVYLSPVLKCIGIGMITHLAAQVCRDAQQGSIASAVELCGTLCALYISLPLIRSLLAIVEQLL